MAKSQDRQGREKRKPKKSAAEKAAKAGAGSQVIQAFGQGKGKK